MDIFTHTSDASALPAYAARIMVAIGKAQAQTGSEARNVLASEPAEGVWTLSVVLALWNRSALSGAAAQAAERIVQAAGAAQMLSALNLLRPQLEPFLQAAFRATQAADLAAAAVYFQAALRGLGPSTLMALRAPQVVALRQKLLTELALPADVSEMYGASFEGSVPKPPNGKTTEAVEGRVVGVKGTPVRKPRPPTAVPSPNAEQANSMIREDPEEEAAARVPGTPLAKVNSPSVSYPVPRSSRADRFDRADFTVNRPLPAPSLDQHERLLALLHIQGWSADAVEKIAKGPKG